MTDDLRPPYRIAFDNARDPYTARNALGISNVAVSYQPLDAELTAIAGLTSAADQLPYFTGSGTAALTTLTSVARTVLDDASTGAMLTTLGAASSANFPAGAWTNWTPTISASIGTITTSTVFAARYIKLGKFVAAFFNIGIGNQGTGSGFLQLSFPVTTQASQAGMVFGREVGATGAAISGSVISTTTMGMLKYDGAGLVITGYNVVGMMIYEAA